MIYQSTRNELVEIIQLLEKDESSWTSHFKKALIAFDNENYQLCGEIILSGSGGMGSLNDLVLGQSVDRNGAFQWKQNHIEINEQFQSLLGSLYAFSHNLRKAVNKFKNGNASELARTPHKTRRPF